MSEREQHIKVFSPEAVRAAQRLDRALKLGARLHLSTAFWVELPLQTTDQEADVATIRIRRKHAIRAFSRVAGDEYHALKEMGELELAREITANNRRGY